MSSEKITNRMIDSAADFWAVVVAAAIVLFAAAGLFTLITLTVPWLLLLPVTIAAWWSARRITRMLRDDV